MHKTLHVRTGDCVFHENNCTQMVSLSTVWAVINSCISADLLVITGCGKEKKDNSIVNLLHEVYAVRMWQVGSTS